MAAARRHDPIPRFARYLAHHGLLDEVLDGTLGRRADEEVGDAVRYASSAPGPPVDWAFKDVYATR